MKASVNVQERDLVLKSLGINKWIGNEPGHSFNWYYSPSLEGFTCFTDYQTLESCLIQIHSEYQRIEKSKKQAS